ncbi:MAG: GAF domain-containing protein [Bacteroidales bacterium]|nr:GAF domain-containing protein [Bacteroidales bacterium]
MIKKILTNTGVQLLSLISILILSTAFIIFYIGINVNTLSDINTFYENLNQFTIVSVQLKDDLSFFKTEKHTDDFFETSTDESTKNVYNTKNDLSEINRKLKEYKSAERYEVLPHFNLNETLLSEYSEKFNLLIKNTVETGNVKYGYLQKLNYEESRINDIVSETEDIYFEFNDIKSLKQQYFLSLKPNIADEFIIKQQELIRKIKQNDNESSYDTNKRLIIDALAEYLNYFKQIVRLHQIAGTSYYGGLYNELDMLSEEMIINISDAAQISKNHIRQDYRQYKQVLVLFIGIYIVVILLILFLLYKYLKKGFVDIKNKVNKLVFEDNSLPFFKTEKFFNNVLNMLRTHESDLGIKKEVVENLTLGKIEHSYTFNEKDLLGQSIVNLQNTMIENKKNAQIEEEKRKIEDKHKEGTAKFGRILRRHVGDIDSLSYELISELVNFIDAEIGGIYVIDKQKGKTVLRLRASYAYNEKKMIQKEIELGEGLIGTCAVDKSTFHIDKVDDDYIKVVSGFGHTKPTSIIISPILVDEDVYGVIELAAMRMFNEDDIRFIEVLAEDIAYTLSYLLSLETPK